MGHSLILERSIDLLAVLGRYEAVDVVQGSNGTVFSKG